MNGFKTTSVASISTLLRLSCFLLPFPSPTPPPRPHISFLSKAHLSLSLSLSLSNFFSKHFHLSRFISLSLSFPPCRYPPLSLPPHSVCISLSKTHPSVLFRSPFKRLSAAPFISASCDPTRLTGLSLSLIRPSNNNCGKRYQLQVLSAFS